MLSIDESDKRNQWEEHMVWFQQELDRYAWSTTTENNEGNKHTQTT